MNKRTNCKNLFFFVGNSGSGKDSLMKATAQILEKMGKRVFIVKRYITRSCHSSENFYSISKEDFLKMKKNDQFALNWSIYDLHYGCPITFEEKINSGKIVFINVSRNILGECKEKYPNSNIIYIKVPIEIAKERLLQRGREKGRALQERLERMNKKISIPYKHIEIENNNKLDKTAERLVDKILNEF